MIVVLPHTIADNEWFDANPLMENFIALKNAVNGQLDEDNLSPNSHLGVASATVNDSIELPSFQQTGSLAIKLTANTSFSVLSGYQSMFSVSNNTAEVLFSGAFPTLPVGAILPFDGTWVDNVTIPGWYKCDGNNGTVNLLYKFIRGGLASGATGGTNDAVLIEHTHTATFGYESVPHTHSVTGSSTSNEDLHYHIFTINTSASGTNVNGSTIPASEGASTGSINASSSSPGHTHSISASSGANSATHTHTVSLANQGLPAGSNMPAYYTTVFIQRTT